MQDVVPGIIHIVKILTLVQLKNGDICTYLTREQIQEPCE